MEDTEADRCVTRVWNISYSVKEPRVQKYTPVDDISIS